MPDDKLYSLDDAKLELARRECAIHGHDYNVVTVTGSNEPSSVECERCHRSWKVESDAD